jgi:hypothetical protein
MRDLEGGHRNVMPNYQTYELRQNDLITSASVLGGARFAFFREVTRSWVAVTRTFSVTRLMGFWPGTILLIVPVQRDMAHGEDGEEQ